MYNAIFSAQETGNGMKSSRIIQQQNTYNQLYRTQSDTVLVLVTLQYVVIKE